MEYTTNHIFPANKNSGCFKTLILIGVFIVFVFSVFGFQTPKQEKRISITATETQWRTWMQSLNYVYDRLRYTNLAASEVTFMQDSIIVPIQISVYTQMNAQLKDTITKKNN